MVLALLVCALPICGSGCRRNAQFDNTAFSRFWGFHRDPACGDAGTKPEGWLAKFTAPHKVDENGFDAAEDPFLALNLDTDQESSNIADSMQIAAATNTATDPFAEMQAANSGADQPGVSGATAELFPWEIAELQQQSGRDNPAVESHPDTLFSATGELHPTAMADVGNHADTTHMIDAQVQTAEVDDGAGEGNPFLLVEESQAVTEVSSDPSDPANNLTATPTPGNPNVPGQIAPPPASTRTDSQLDRLKNALSQDARRTQQTPPAVLKPDVVRSRIERMMQQSREQIAAEQYAAALRTAKAAQQLAELTSVFFGPDDDNPADLVSKLVERVKTLPAAVATTPPIVAPGPGAVATPAEPLAVADNPFASIPPEVLNPALPQIGSTPAVGKPETPATPAIVSTDDPKPDWQNQQPVPLAPPATQQADPVVAGPDPDAADNSSNPEQRVAASELQNGSLDRPESFPRRVSANHAASVAMQPSQARTVQRPPVENLPPIQVAMTEPAPRPSAPVAPLPRPSDVSATIATGTPETVPDPVPAAEALQTLYPQAAETVQPEQIPNVQWQASDDAITPIGRIPRWLIPAGIGVGLFVVIALTFIRRRDEE